MARLRTIKPSFFLNEDLSRVPPLGRLLFAGLWCIADRQGRLEDRPNRIKVETLPYDRCNVDSLLKQLMEGGFIERYEVDGKRYIQIVKFEKHQTPHIKEVPSTIPAPYSSDASTAPVSDEAPTLPPCVLGSGNRSSVSWEPDYGDLGVGSGDQAAPAASPPAQLAAFDEVLRRVTGYAPDERLYSAILSRYPDADYDTEALKLADHLRRGGKEASASRILNWFKGIRETSRPPPAKGRPISWGEALKDEDRFARDEYLQQQNAEFRKKGVQDGTAQRE